jgi:predicted TIM-barrel fold metal-dependent hydrolase
MNDLSFPTIAPSEAPILPGPLDSIRAPHARFPPGSCDCHAHVFGPDPLYPYVGNAAYRFPLTTVERFEAMLAVLGCTRGVLVQPSVYGTDNRCMLAALRARPDTMRGVAVVDPDISDAQLRELDAAGVRGIRINVSSKTSVLRIDDAPLLAARIAPLGWHLQFFAKLDQVPELSERLRGLPVRCVIDHFGHIDANDGATGAGFRQLLDLAALDHVWFKLVGPYRLSSRAPHFPDVTPLARRLIDAAPERCVWASDWPHPNASPMPNDGDLANALFDWAPDPAIRQRILVDNPALLYGFDAAAVPRVN